MRRIADFFTRSFTERNAVVIGAIGVSLILAVVSAAVFLNKNVFGGGEVLQARFSNAAGLQSGARVVVAGVPVGSVTKLQVQGKWVYAHLRVSNVELPVDTSAGIAVETLLGQVAVQLIPGHQWGQLLASGSTITHTSVPTEFQDLENETSHLLSQSDVPALNTLVTSLANVTAGKQTQVAQIITGLDQLTTTIDTRQVEVGKLIDSANVVSSALVSRDTQLVSVVDNLGTVLAGLDNERQQVSNLISGVEQVANQTADLVGQNRARLDDLLNQATSDLDVVSAHQIDLAQGVSYLASALKGFASINFSGPNNAPNHWANTFVNLAGSGDPVLGACGALDNALDTALGPDPTACKDRLGPPITPGAQAPGAHTSGAPQAGLAGLAGGAAGVGPTSGTSGTGATAGTGAPLTSGNSAASGSALSTMLESLLGAS
jgi:phospholipid/cholesterol/gamma-HCH transport system substrate-binding protein